MREILEAIGEGLKKAASVLWRFIKRMIKRTVRSIKYCAKKYLRPIANLIELILPYVMFLIGQRTMLFSNELGFEPIIFIALAAHFMIYLSRALANKLGGGSSIPIPMKRFTSVDDYDEVTIRNDRLQELLLYTADLEDWFERKGLL